MVQVFTLAIFFIAQYNDLQLMLGIGAHGPFASDSYPALLQQLSGIILPCLHGAFFGMIVSAILYAAAEGHWPWFEDADWAVGLLIQQAIGIIGTLVGYSLGIQYGLWYQTQFNATTIASLNASGVAENLFGGMIFILQQMITAIVIIRRRRCAKKGFAMNDSGKRKEG
jgi:hypothetical protein